MFLFLALSDYDISSTSGLKRMKKSTTRTLEFLDKTTSGSSNGADLFATVELGWFKVDGEEANKTVKAMLTNKLDAIKGFIISGYTYYNLHIARLLHVAVTRLS